jgi:hypothetical protein
MHAAARGQLNEHANPMEANMNVGRDIRTYTIEPATSPVPEPAPVEEPAGPPAGR